MTEQLQELLEKINREGVEKAENKAKEIISAATEKAKSIVETADKQAAEEKETAVAAATRVKENAEKAIQQSARNVMISLREEIQKYFDRILNAAIAESLPPKELTTAILKVIEKGGAAIGGSPEVEVAVNPEDAEKISADLVARFRKDVAGKLTVHPVPAIDAGFTVSFDGGKSSYDFTDAGLRDLLSTYLSPHLKEIISR